MPENRQVITGRCGFKLKKDRNGQILKYKARWVAHGFKQEKGIDFVETFAAVVKPIAYKCLFGVSLKCGYKIWQMDVVTAFLYRLLDDIIYIEQPHLVEPNPELVCRLCKSLYWLKQAPKVRYKTLADFLKKLGLERLKLDHGVFVSQDRQLFLAIYVDDLLLYLCLLPTNHASQISRTNSAPDSKRQTWGKYFTTQVWKLTLKLENRFLFGKLSIW